MTRLLRDRALFAHAIVIALAAVVVVGVIVGGNNRTVSYLVRRAVEMALIRGDLKA